MASSDFLKVLEYAKENRVRLENYLNCTSNNSNEESSEILRYREFFKDLEDSAKLMHKFNTCDRDKIRKLGEMLWKLKEEAEMKKEMTANGDLYCMYFQFVNDESLIKMVSVLDHAESGKSTGAEEFRQEDRQKATARHVPNGHADFEAGVVAGNVVRPDPDVQYQFGTTHGSYTTSDRRGGSRDQAYGPTGVHAAMYHVERHGTEVPKANDIQRRIMQSDARVHEEFPLSTSLQQGPDTDVAHEAVLYLRDHSAPQHGKNQSSRNRGNAVPGSAQKWTEQDPLRYLATTPSSAPPQSENADHAKRKLEAETSKENAARGGSENEVQRGNYYHSSKSPVLPKKRNQSDEELFVSSASKSQTRVTRAEAKEQQHQTSDSTCGFLGDGRSQAKTSGADAPIVMAQFRNLLKKGKNETESKRTKVDEIEREFDRLKKASRTTNASGRNPNERSEGARSGNAVPDPPGGTAASLVRYSRCSAFQGQDPLSTGTELKTFKQALDAFHLYPRLMQLEKSLGEVQRHRKRPQEHDELCKQIDKELQVLCREHHPDKVMNKNGSREEIELAKERQTAINAIRTVLKTLSKIFLEEIDVDHRYEFYAHLDIGQLGNEDEVEGHVYDVLFKISLVSDIKQERIVAEIRRFLEDAQRSLDSFLSGDQRSFKQYFDRAFASLKRCVSGYEKLHEELVEVEKECREERVNNIRPVIRDMKRDCSQQLGHLKLLEPSKQSSGKLPSMYRPASETVDAYFVLPLVNYVNVLLACDVMRRTEENTYMQRFCNQTNEGAWLWGWLGFSNRRPHGSTLMDPQPISDGLHSPPPLLKRQPISDGGDEISLLHQLASCYSGSKQHKHSVKQLFNWYSMDPINVKREFVKALWSVRDELAAMFRPEDYVEGGTRKHILKELDVCREMMSEFKQRATEVRMCLQEIRANNERVRRGIDQLLIDRSAIGSDMSELRVDAQMFREQIENYRRERQ